MVKGGEIKRLKIVFFIKKIFKLMEVLVNVLCYGFENEFSLGYFF